MRASKLVATLAVFVTRGPHYDNILAGDLDPKPIAGDPELAVAELLFTQVDELQSEDDLRTLLAVVVDAATLDAEKAATWAFTRTIDYCLRGLEQELTVDPPRCYRVAEALESLLP